MRMFLIVLTILMFTTVALSEEMVSVPKSYLLKVKDRLEKLQALEKAVPTIKIKGIEVVQDAKNRVFIKDTASVEIKLAMLEFADDVSIKGKVKQYFIPKSAPFVSRFGLMTAYDFELKESTNFENSLYLTYAAFRYGKTGLELAVNTEKYSIGLSRRLTPNTRLYFGAAMKYNSGVKGQASGVLGAMFNF